MLRLIYRRQQPSRFVYFFRLPIWPFRDPRQWTMNSSHQIKFNNRSPSFIIYCSLWDYNKWCIELITVQSIKPWSNGLASQRKTSVRLVSNLRFVWPATCVVLHGLALTLVELKFVRKSTQVFHRLATKRKSTQVDRKSTVYDWNLRLFATCELELELELANRLANLFGHPSQVRTQVLVLKTCVDLRVRLANRRPRVKFNKEIQVYFTSRTLVFTNSHQFGSTESLYKFPLEASNMYLQRYSIGFNQL